jgi:putative methionine-R-sulfoxide reductase with GAF domain
MLNPQATRQRCNDPSLFEALLSRLFRELHRCDTPRECAWAITSQVIPYLELEDCVVYLSDSTQQTLLQAAAFGAKVVAPGVLETQVTLRFGQGIVGHAALLRETILVPDTSLDTRYVVDLNRRMSELAVPILHQDQLLAVLDSEHSQKHFFTPDHVRLFETVAFIAAPFFARYHGALKPFTR